ncbi:MAG: hypothetical protein KQI81_16470 [Deltaproteobacteria bacterium]|nr:hypothetical protein [Deltaproteobacteria bacterium]
MVTQANLSSIVTINKGPLYQKALKRIEDLYPKEILRVCGIIELAEEAMKEAP